ncbi:MAG TPA: response regulator [Pyrinomonadaceae bacterium]|jgi:CheY-like chemotaxis protein
MKRKILVVEDYEDARLFMKYLLESYGYQVIEAADGLEAVEALKSQFPDLILMDIGLPLMDGLTATRAIRKFKQGADIPIIAVTIHGRELYKKAIEAGFNDLLTKPVDFSALEALLNQYLEE